jgi:hypothetical protein
LVIKEENAKLAYYMFGKIKMTTYDKLQKAYPNRVLVLKKASEIPTDKQLVYILTYNDNAIVVGRGKKNRADVIFDDLENITVHVKALKVRLHHLFRQGNDIFARYIITCQNEAESKEIEKRLHEKIGGNTLNVDERLIQRLFKGINKGSPEWIVLKIALCSSYDGISDLKKWKREGIVDANLWKAINDKLKINYEK